MLKTCEVLDDASEVIEALIEWIDAVPQDTPLPVMPGLDRDWVERVLQEVKSHNEYLYQKAMEK